MQTRQQLREELPDFTNIYLHNYAINTLINGNLTECIRYLNELLSTKSIAGILEVNDQLTKIDNFDKNKAITIKNNLKI